MWSQSEQARLRLDTSGGLDDDLAANRVIPCHLQVRDPERNAFDTEQRLTMRFDDESGVVADPDAEERRAWDGLR